MKELDWAQKYAQMDERIAWKYEQLPCGEQVGKDPSGTRGRTDATY
jgi:hypothetical protein